MYISSQYEAVIFQCKLSNVQPCIVLEPQNWFSSLVVFDNHYIYYLLDRADSL